MRALGARGPNDLLQYNADYWDPYKAWASVTRANDVAPCFVVMHVHVCAWFVRETHRY